jgi:hypothetical protein
MPKGGSIKAWTQHKKSKMLKCNSDGRRGIVSLRAMPARRHSVSWTLFKDRPDETAAKSARRQKRIRTQNLRTKSRPETGEI